MSLSAENENYKILERSHCLEENQNPLDLHRFNSQETIMISNSPTSEELSIAPGEGKQPSSNELAFPYPNRKFGYKVEREIELSPVKYLKRFLYEVLAMVKQLGIPTFFMTLSCADLHWNELISIIAKLKGENLQDEHMNRNPVLLARHFQSNSYKWALSKIPCNQGSLSSSWKSSYSFFFVDCKCTNFE